MISGKRNEKGKYDAIGEKRSAKKHFHYRSKLITDRNGYYEYETIMPGHYLNGSQYRPAHIHYMVEAPGYKKLITQLYFKNDPYNKIDPFIKKSLIIEPRKIKAGQGEYLKGEFDIVLPPDSQSARK